MNAGERHFPNGYFDLVVSHILLHEASGKAMPRIFSECNRLLAPAGYLIHADLPPLNLMDPFTQFILDNETWYKNEPLSGAMRDLDQHELAERPGFDRVQVKFDTAPMAVMEFAAQAAGCYNEEAAQAAQAETEDRYGATIDEIATG